MIRVLALAHMVGTNGISSTTLFNACGQDDTYIDLINILPYVRPLDGDDKTITAARLKAGIKPEDIRRADGSDYTNQQMYRMKKSERIPDAAVVGVYVQHSPGWYPEQAKNFYINVLSNIQLNRVYYGGVDSICKVKVLQLLKNKPTFIRMMQEIPEYNDCWKRLKMLPEITGGMLTDIQKDYQLYKMLQIPKGNTPNNYYKKEIPDSVYKFIEDYSWIIDAIYEDIINLQCQGFLNENLMLRGGEGFEFI